METALVLANFALVLVTAWYAWLAKKTRETLERQADATSKQAAAAGEQAAASRATLEHLLRQELPEWTHAGGGIMDTRQAGVRLRNIGGGPAERIRVYFEPLLPPGLRSAPEIGDVVGPVPPNETFMVAFMAELKAPVMWAGEVVLRCSGRHARMAEYRLPVRVWRRDRDGVMVFELPAVGVNSYPSA